MNNDDPITESKHSQAAKINGILNDRDKVKLLIIILLIFED